MLACAPIPKGRYTLDSISVKGNARLDDDEIQESIASRESARFLGLFSGVIYDYEVFDRYVLERDLQRIERFYRTRGYYEARVRAARVEYKGRGAKVMIEIEEGVPVKLARIDLHGLETLPVEARKAAEAAAAADIRIGRPFEEEAFATAEDNLKSRLGDQGYAYVKVKRSANVDLPRRLVSAGFWVELGPKAVYGPVRIEGLGPFPEPPVRRALDLRTGDPYSRSELDEAKRALLELNVFTSVSIEPDGNAKEAGAKEAGAKEAGAGGSGAQPTQVPLVVRVERSKVRAVHLGGGVQLDTQRTDVHLLAGWENSNFLGGFRRLLVEAVPGMVLFPTRLPDLKPPRKLLPQLKLRSEFRQPGFIEARTNALLRLEGSIYPNIPTVYIETDPVIGYRDLRASAGLERSLWRFYGAATHTVQVSSPFTYVGDLDEDLGTVLVSYPELFVTLDLRNDRVNPHKGAFASFNAQFAGVGGDARDVKLQPEARFYIPVARRWTIATRGTVGFLLPQNYGDTVAPNMETHTSGGVSRSDWVKDTQLMYLRGFFSGGSGSNRGYASREIGPHGVVPFYNPGQSLDMSEAACGADTFSAPECNRPLGGFTLWEASLELRHPLMGPLTGTIFGDMSDVSAHRATFRFTHPHFSVGFGLRYATPIGPVRFDLGYRIPGMQGTGPGEVEPAEIFGVPLAASFGIGEVF